MGVSGQPHASAGVQLYPFSKHFVNFIWNILVGVAMYQWCRAYEHLIISTKRHCWWNNTSLHLMEILYSVFPNIVLNKKVINFFNIHRLFWNCF